MQHGIWGVERQYPWKDKGRANLEGVQSLLEMWFPSLENRGLLVWQAAVSLQSWVAEGDLSTGREQGGWNLPWPQERCTELVERG